MNRAPGRFKIALSGNTTIVADVVGVMSGFWARPVGQMAHLHAVGRDFRFVGVPPRPSSTILTVS